MNLQSFISRLTGRNGGFRPAGSLPRSDLKHANLSFAQFGEDLALLRYFDQRQGFYVDVGAHHPVRFSNTYLLYQRGWCGINVDANPDALELFRSGRPRDINVQAAVSDVVQDVEFNLYEESALCRIAVQNGPGAETNPRMPTPLRKIKLTTTTLAQLLSDKLPPGQKVDFLNIDCEGHDLAVLASNDWNRFRPEVVAVEDWKASSQTRMDEFLRQRGYELVFLQKPAKLYACTN